MTTHKAEIDHTCPTCGTSWTAPVEKCPTCCCGPSEGCSSPDCTGTPAAGVGAPEPVDDDATEFSRSSLGEGVATGTRETPAGGKDYIDRLPLTVTVLPPYHRHGSGLDLVPGAPEGCIDPESNPSLVLAFTPEALASYVEEHVTQARREGWVKGVSAVQAEAEPWCSRSFACTRTPTNPYGVVYPPASEVRDA